MADRTLINFHPKSKPTYVFYSYGGVFVFFMDAPCNIGYALQTYASSCLVDAPSIWKVWTSTGFILSGWKKNVVETTTQELFSIPDGV